MCGISGIIGSRSVDELSSLIRKVNNALAHRGPDADAFWVEGGIALGHRRLSILDLSTAANQPFQDASGRYVMVFNGEVYNYNELKSQLPEYPFRTTSDTEAVIAAYAKWGPESLHLLKGMFSIVIWDRQKRSLFMARDRFGVKPLYYYKDDGQLLFASEVRALLASGLVPRKIDIPALADYLKYQSFVAPSTPVKEVYQLPAGRYMIWKDGKTEEKVYWDLTTRKKNIGSMDLPVVHKTIRDLLYRSVERRLVSDVPLGAFLSGGIDSSAVVGIMSQIRGVSTNAFTIAFDEGEYNELPYAQLVAKKFGVHHDTVLLRATDFLDSLPAALDALDIPSGDGVNTYVVSGAIKRNGMTVALSGIGGDELFAGYPIFRQFQRLRKWRGIFDHTKGVRRLAAGFVDAGGQQSGRLKYLLNISRADISHIYPFFRQIQNPYSIDRLAVKGLFDERAGQTLDAQLKELQQNIGRFDDFSQVSIADYLGYTQSVLLKDSDQMGMAASLEIREPFFDHELVEYVLNVPDNIKDPVYPKKLLVESLEGLLPDEVVFRKKQGFVIPYDIWLRGDLRVFSTERIRRLAGRGIFREKALLNYWDNYLQGKHNIRWADVWVFIVLEHWLEKNGVA
jgi:asparagine synthase (glutamine-hydrolysing)